MATIITKNSSTAGAVPIAGDLVQGEIAVNVTDKKLYTKNASGSVVQITPVVNDNGFKNRIINGAMVIDQRNAGASVTPTDTSGRPYALDRWCTRQSQASKFSIQRSSTAPTGFVSSSLITSASAYSITSSDQFVFIQTVEGLNTSDLSWGTANATAVTLSFQVRSSLTGTFGGSLRNSAADRSYPFSYTINAANTWETKTVTIAGDTSGTWLTTNGIGILVGFGLGVGSTLSGAAGSWASGNYASATGATSVVGTSGATFYITGVQLEKGSTATSFDYRPYGTELALCQRYYIKLLAGASSVLFGSGFCYTTTSFNSVYTFPVPMRTPPTALEQSGTASHYSAYTSAGSTACSAVPTFTSAFEYSAWTTFTVASGLTAGQGGFARASSGSAYLAWSAEL